MGALYGSGVAKRPPRQKQATLRLGRLTEGIDLDAHASALTRT
jgi:hypothetical protein